MLVCVQELPSPRLFNPEPTPQELKARAEAKLKFRAEQAADKPKAMYEYRAAEYAQRELTAKLRSERLVRERLAKK
jgi:hypothetical protein